MVRSGCLPQNHILAGNQTPPAKGRPQRGANSMSGLCRVLCRTVCRDYVGTLSGLCREYVGTMSNYSSGWNTRVEYQGVHGGVSRGKRGPGACRPVCGTMSVLCRDYVGVMSGLCRGYVGFRPPLCRVQVQAKEA